MCDANAVMRLALRIIYGISYGERDIGIDYIDWIVHSDVIIELVLFS